MSRDTERFAQRERVARIQRLARELFGDDGGEMFRLRVETELVEAAEAEFRRGKREGMDLRSRVPANSTTAALAEYLHEPPKSSPDEKRTPVLHPRAAREVNVTTTPRRRPK